MMARAVARSGSTSATRPVNPYAVKEKDGQVWVLWDR